jgi:hypothetical protein
MKIYAELPTVRTRQLLDDIAVVAWLGGAAWVASRLHATVDSFAAAGKRVEDTGRTLSGQLADASEKADNVPGIGDSLARPFDGAAGAADAVTRAGTSYQETVHTLATTVQVLVVAVAVVIVLAGWLPRRLRWARAASTGARLRADPAGRDLLALRALSTRTLEELRAVSPDPAGGWRRGEPETVAALVSLELRSVGLRPG